MSEREGTTAPLSGATPEAVDFDPAYDEHFSIKRPDDISDGRWAAIRAQAHMLFTGHAPWCDAHVKEDGERGWCQRSIKVAIAEVVVSNGTVEGNTEISLYVDEAINLDALTVGQARCISAGLQLAADVAWRGNIGIGLDETA